MIPQTAKEAAKFLNSLTKEEVFIFEKHFFDLAIKGCPIGAECKQTLERWLNGKPVTDKFLVGLAFIVLITKYIEREENEHIFLKS